MHQGTIVFSFFHEYSSISFRTNLKPVIRNIALPDETAILIYVVDDDASVRKALTMLFMSADMQVKTFEAAEDLLKCQLREQNTCLISDMKLKGLSGIELQQQLTERGVKIPVIFLTAFDSNEIRQQAKQGGAVGYFRKPVDDQALLDTIHWAISSCISSKE
jgi:FixJ family two-component response regulator